MNFLITMAGEGRRFREAGYALPKMLIEAKGKTLLEWSIDSLPLNLCSRLIFVAQQKHEDDFRLSEKIRSIYGDRVNLLINLPEANQKLHAWQKILLIFLSHY